MTGEDKPITATEIVERRKEVEAELKRSRDKFWADMAERLKRHWGEIQDR